MGKFIVALLQRLLVDMSPELREKLRAALVELQAKAKESPNPVDDLFVSLLQVLCGFDEI